MVVEFFIVLSSEKQVVQFFFSAQMHNFMDNSQRPHGGLSLCPPSWRAHVYYSIHITPTAAFMRHVVSVFYNVSHVKFPVPSLASLRTEENMNWWNSIGKVTCPKFL